MGLESIGRLFSDIENLLVREIVDAPIWTTVSSSQFLNSNFATTLIGSVVGAGFGAWAGAHAAQRIAARAKLKDELQREIRGTNEAIAVAVAIFGSALRLKASGVLAMKLRFDQDLAEWTVFSEEKRHLTGAVFHFNVDQETITPFPIPVDVLQTLVFEKTSVRGRPHQLALQIPQIWHSPTEVIVGRNKLIEEFRERWASESLPPHIYLGLPDKDGNVDARFSTTLDGIYQQTNDCIAFSKMLCEDLERHGRTIYKASEKRFGKRSVPRVTVVDFDLAAAKGLLPPARNYSDWETNFVVRPPDPTLLSRIATATSGFGNRGLVALSAIRTGSGQMVGWVARKIRRIYFALSSWRSRLVMLLGGAMAGVK